MKRFIEGEDQSQIALLPECLDDFIAEDNPVRVAEAFVEELDLQGVGFDGAQPAETGRPSYHPAVLLKIYIYGYLKQIQSSRRLEREAQRNVELMFQRRPVAGGPLRHIPSKGSETTQTTGSRMSMPSALPRSSTKPIVLSKPAAGTIGSSSGLKKSSQ